MVTQQRKATGEQTYRGGGGSTTLTRYRYELRGELRLPDGRTHAIATSAEVRELPDVAEFSSWKADTGITSWGGEARGYRRASADVIVAAAESVRSALATKLAPLPVAGAGPSEHPSVWEGAAGLLTACPEHGVAPCSGLHALRRGIIEASASDARLPVVDELRGLLAKHGTKGPGDR